MKRTRRRTLDARGLRRIADYARLYVRVREATDRLMLGVDVALEKITRRTHA